MCLPFLDDEMLRSARAVVEFKGNSAGNPQSSSSMSVSRTGLYYDVRRRGSTIWTVLLLSQENEPLFWEERHTIAFDMHIYMLVRFYDEACGYRYWHTHIFVASLLSLKSRLIGSFSWTWKTVLPSASVIYATAYWRMTYPGLLLE